MDDIRDERKKTHLRLVVDNVEKRSPRPADSGSDCIPFEELAANRDNFRAEFYGGLPRGDAKVFAGLENFFAGRGWPYGLDFQHGRIIVLPVGIVVPEMADFGGVYHDEMLVMVGEDMTGEGMILSLETILPFYSEDEAVMEESLLYAPILSYGALFLEENRQDGYLDLIYRLAFPLFSASTTDKLFGRMFAVAAHEMREVMQNLLEYPEG